LLLLNVQIEGCKNDAKEISASFNRY
jgi:hypothetical protein